MCYLLDYNKHIKYNIKVVLLKIITTFFEYFQKCMSLDSLEHRLKLSLQKKKKKKKFAITLVFLAFCIVSYFEVKLTPVWDYESQ